MLTLTDLQLWQNEKNLTLTLWKLAQIECANLFPISGCIAGMMGSKKVAGVNDTSCDKNSSVKEDLGPRI